MDQKKRQAKKEDREPSVATALSPGGPGPGATEGGGLVGLPKAANSSGSSCPSLPPSHLAGLNTTILHWTTSFCVGKFYCFPIFRHVKNTDFRGVSSKQRIRYEIVSALTAGCRNYALLSEQRSRLQDLLHATSELRTGLQELLHGLSELRIFYKKAYE